MVNKIKYALLNLAFVLTCILGVTAANMAPVAALDCSNPVTPAEREECGACITDPSSCPSTNPEDTLQNTIRRVVNLLTVVTGVVAVVMVIVAGFRYVTSGGNAESVKNARNTILYAIIGLVIVAFAQVIVRFVLHNSNG